ncbi:hypothetical protein Tco_1026555 [Tanacetum coccineum]
MKRPPFLEPNEFCFWKARFETYVKSKDIDLWQVIQTGNFYYEVEDSETKLMKETPYALLEDDQYKKLGKNNEAKMTLYNALLHIEYERVFMCKTTKEVWHTLIITHQGNSQVKNCKIDLLTQEYEKFSISNEETIDRGDYSDSQDERDEDVDEEEEAEAFNLLARNFRLEKAAVIALGTNVVKAQSQRGTRPLSEELRVIVKTVIVTPPNRVPSD